MKLQKIARGLGVAVKQQKTRLFYVPPDARDDVFRVAESANGRDFQTLAKIPTILSTKKTKQPTGPFDGTDFRISKQGLEYYLTYKRPSQSQLVIAALSEDLSTFAEVGALAGVRETATLVPDYTWDDQYVMYIGEKTVKIAFSKTLKTWHVSPSPVLHPREHYFDDKAITVGNLFVENEGVVLIYYAEDSSGKISIGAAVFDRDNPRKATWRSDYPLWEAPSDWPTRIVHPLGIIEFERTLMAYWEVDGAIYASALPRFWRDRNWPGQIPATAPALQRYEGNPVLEPRATHPWDAVAAFNPTALHEDGKTHILYRAIGVGDVSVIGHAVSKDGSDIHYRSDHPVYAPREPFEGAGHKHKGINPKQYPNMAYISGGGGAGGCEDPRLTRIDDTVYMTYVAYDGGSPPRVALTSIGIDDFLEGEWNWTKPVLISEPGVINKNACILPEKINGKYVIFHRVYPDILIDYVDDLEFDGETKWLETKAKISPRATAWDSRKIGVGPTPLKTDKGWLVIYQAVGEQDPSRYKMGAMLLDLKDPSKVLYRSRHPILEPVEWYENNGHKYGVIYPCGAVIRDDMLYVYYGGADKVVCVASAPLKEFLEQLISTESPHLRAVSVG